jgi:MinD-like ATPase involved in chromosome partitioning or flagellar assembly
MLRVATALTDAILESAVVKAVTTAAGEATVVRRCRDVVELRAVAVTRQIDAAVVDGELRGMDRDVVASLAAVGVRCIAVADNGRERLLAMGVTDVVDRRLTGLDAALRGSGAPPTVVQPSIAPPAEARSGLIVTVWGPTGAPGRTTIAVELAAVIAGAGRDTLLVDADTVGPSIALHLGLIDDTSGLAAAVRAASRGRLDPVVLAGLAVTVPAGPRVLVGLPSADRWTELRPASVDALLQCARETVPVTIVDVGFGVEGGDLDWADPGAPVRYGAARAALAAADVVVCVGRPDPVGMLRLIRGLPEIRNLAPTAAELVVVNRVRTRTEQQRVVDLLIDESGCSHVVTIPDEPRAAAAAMAGGVTIAEQVPRSALVTGVEGLAAQVLLLGGSYDQAREPATRSDRRLLRGAHRRHRHRDARVV